MQVSKEFSSIVTYVHRSSMRYAESVWSGFVSTAAKRPTLDLAAADRGQPVAWLGPGKEITP